MDRPGDFLTTSQAGRLLGVGRETVLAWARQGRFPHAERTAGRHLRIPRADVDRLLRPKPGAGKALLYLRVAEEAQRGLLEKGLVHLVEYALKRGYAVVEVVREVGPGLDGGRPSLAAIRAAARAPAPRYEVVIVETLDRLLLLGGDEFARWASGALRVEVAGPSSPEAQRLYRREVVLDLYYPLADALALRGVPPVKVERVISDGLAHIAEALGLFVERPAGAV